MLNNQVQNKNKKINQFFGFSLNWTKETGFPIRNVKIGNQENHQKRDVVECLDWKNLEKKMQNSVDAHYKKGRKEIRDSLCLCV